MMEAARKAGYIEEERSRREKQIGPFPAAMEDCFISSSMQFLGELSFEDIVNFDFYM